MKRMCNNPVGASDRLLTACPRVTLSDMPGWGAAEALSGRWAGSDKCLDDDSRSGVDDVAHDLTRLQVFVL